MLRTFHVSSKHEYKPGQIVSVYSTMPTSQANEKYKIVKLVHYSKENDLAEYQVKPVDVARDAGNLKDQHGNYKKSIR